MFRDEYHTLCFIWSLLSHVVIKLRHFSFPRERESLSLTPQHTPARLPLLYHIVLSQPPPHLSKSNQHLYKHNQPQALCIEKRHCSMSPLLHPPHAATTSLKGWKNLHQNQVCVWLTRHRWLIVNSQQMRLSWSRQSVIDPSTTSTCFIQ